MKTARIIVGKSGVSGRGVFAGKDFKRGEIICRFTGTVVSIEDMKRIYKRGKSKVSCDAFQIGARKYLLIDEPFVLINHSCDPNTAFKGERTLVARKAIKKGDELFYDYSTTEWTARDYTEYDCRMWPMRCGCGTRSCRGLITCFPLLPKATQKKYLAGTIKSYIRANMKLPEPEHHCAVCEARLVAFRKRAAAR